ncbi:OPT oligopeptide transporter protein-domain-containing protein [Globomyces pollinis-pini]|nr:OPT oligopeptide transporter protein-domain-containing protein [Globomyces pollinis-pini]
MVDIEKQKYRASVVSVATEADEDMADGWTKGIVSLEDNINTPAFSFRVIFLGMFWGLLLGFCSTLFQFRASPFIIPSSIVILLSYPMGIFLERVLPAGPLNPGPFSIKELALIYIMGASAGGQPYGLSNVIGQRWKIFMGDQSITFFNSLPWVLSTQMVGYGVAGLARRFIVRPKSMLWPTVLPTVTLLNSYFETEAPSSKYHMSRLSFFWLTFTFMFMYHWIPAYFASAIGMISLLCISNNRTLRWLGSAGGFEGVGLFSVSLDWTVINQLQGIYTPWWAGLNNFGGYIFFTWILTPIIYLSNPFKVPGGYDSHVGPNKGWNGADFKTDPFPNINNVELYTKNGTSVKIDTTMLLNQDFTLNKEFFNRNQPFHISPAFAVSYLTSFMALGALLSHTALWYGNDIVRQTKEAFSTEQEAETDELCIIMQNYQEVPDFVYLSFLVGFTALSIISGLFTAYKLSIFATLSAIFMGLVFTIPIGIIQAISGSQLGLNVITQFAAGLAMPGNAIGVMCFKSLGYNVMIQALALSADQKIGHYLHIPPRAMFATQMIGTLIGVFTNLGAAFWAEVNLADQFENNSNQWNPISFETFVNASGIWGAIGPAKFFTNSDAPYNSMMWGFLIGFLLPFLPWLMNRIMPNPNWHLINIPLFTFNGNLTGSNQAPIFTGLILCFVFNKFIYDRYREWWTKYTFILGYGFDAGAAVTVTITAFTGFFIAQPGNGPLNPASSRDYYCQGLFWQNTTGPATPKQS